MFVVGVGDAGRARALELVRELRAAGVAADTSFEDRPLKAQLKMADRAGAAYAAIVGERELEAGHRDAPAARGRAAGRCGRRDPRREARARDGSRMKESESIYRTAMRTHACGELTAEHVDAAVVLCGWVASRRDHGGVTFIDLRDREGIVQVVFHPEEAAEAHAAAQRLSSEDVVRVTGTVRARPDGMANPQLPTGEIEVAAASLEVLSEAETPPFPIEDRIEAGEELRLRFRYLDLRRPEMTTILRMRHRINAITRDHMESLGFLEVETPHAHALDAGGCPRLPRAVSPVAGQLLRAPAVAAATEAAPDGRRSGPLLPDRPLPPGRGAARRPELRVHAARRRDVVRRPGGRLRGHRAAVRALRPRDPRRRACRPRSLGSRTTRCSRASGPTSQTSATGWSWPISAPVFEGTGFNAFASVLAREDGAIKGLAAPGGGQLSRKELDQLVQDAKGRGAAGLVWMVVESDGVRSPVEKHLSKDEIDGVLRATGASEGDLVCIVADQIDRVHVALDGAPPAPRRAPRV